MEPAAEAAGTAEAAEAAVASMDTPSVLAASPAPSTLDMAAQTTRAAHTTGTAGRKVSACSSREAKTR